METTLGTYCTSKSPEPDFLTLLDGKCNQVIFAFILSVMSETDGFGSERNWILSFDYGFGESRPTQFQLWPKMTKLVSVSLYINVNVP